MRHLAATALIAPIVLGGIAYAGESAAEDRERPRIEVVFVLDTTGSMSGLIRAAKEKVWAIANTLAMTKPTPIVKMGLVGFRDRRDTYVTKRTDLTDDLDAVYNELMAFKAEGGGDAPESVNQALQEAVTMMQWSTDEDTYRVLFLVGDSPPHMDYTDDVKFPETCKLAARRGIIVNAIQCGSNGSTEPIWRDIALRAEGRYFRVEQSGSAILKSSPFDSELARLAEELDTTRIHYGSTDERAEQEKRVKVAEAICGKASPAAKARRAVFNGSKAGELNFLGDQELANDIKDGRVKLDDVKEDHLPQNMRSMSPEERQGYVADNLAKRKKLQAKIKELAARRQTHIEEEVRRSVPAAQASLDHEIYSTVKAQAAKKGIAYEAGPAY